MPAKTHLSCLNKMGFFVLKISSFSKSIFLASFVLTSLAQLLPQDEVEVLQRISSGLQNEYWINISRSSCVEPTALNQTFVPYRIYSSVVCDCTYNDNTLCHVISIAMPGLNLTGTVPVEFASLSHIREIDLSRNYLSGSIPAVLGQLPLVSLSLIGNLIGGTIPAEIGNITTLEHLILEDNLLQGNLPQDLGSLINLRRLLLSSNLIYGTIPDTFGNLRNLTDFRIDGNRISGRIPDFIGNWTRLQRLDMQGLEGPIPDIINQLRNLTSLRIFDLNGTSMSFPNLQDMRVMQDLVLRNCSITGPIPEYLVNMTTLRTLDLSLNMLNGQIPSILQSLTMMNFMFLTHNSLTGEIPGWILDSRQNIDVSYNNFTRSRDVGCQLLNINVVSSLSPSAGNLVPWCMQQNLPCPRDPNRHSFFINCGGGRTNYEGNEYDENTSDEGPSHFESFNDSWAYSSTGTYTGNDRARFIATNVTVMNPAVGDIYRTARLSPVSLKYYGLCLRNGSYRVRLHFAEIMFIRAGPNFNSLGRRIFDVAIQGVVVLRDFNIAEAAGGGVGIGIYREFNNVLVNDSTLEIHLYWAGKGTRAIPDRGVYGPLISAIAVTSSETTVTPNFDVGTGLSVGAIIGIAVSSCVVVLLVLIFLWKKWCFGSKDVEDKDIRGLNLQTSYFSLRHIKAATNNFDIANKIGEGGFGPVYKGVMSDGSLIAVKQLSSRSKQGNREFVNEIGMISAIQHPNLVKLFGCCIEGNQLLLIYEYLKNNSLARALFGTKERKLNLDWPTRRKICLGIAKGLAFLHEESKLKMVHRDIKATNILLDNELNAKISDFGLAKLNEEDNTHMSTRVAGTLGYMAPEYAMRGYLTDKADVYSFGIVLLEIVSGKSITEYRPTEEFVYLPEWASVLLEQGNLSDLVDPNLGSNYSNEEATLMLNLSLLCVNPSHSLRPSMSSVVSMINGETPVHAPKEDLNAIEILSQDISSDDDEPCIESLSFLSVKDESQPPGSLYGNSTSSLSLKFEGGSLVS